LNKQLKPIWVE